MLIQPLVLLAIVIVLVIIILRLWWRKYHLYLVFIEHSDRKIEVRLAEWYRPDDPNQRYISTKIDTDDLLSSTKRHLMRAKCEAIARSVEKELKKTGMMEHLTDEALLLHLPEDIRQNAETAVKTYARLLHDDPKEYRKTFWNMIGALPQNEYGILERILLSLYLHRHLNRQ